MNRTSAERLALGPRSIYPVKAALTRARSVTWLLRTRGRRRGHGVRILYYHRVSDDRDELAVGCARFRAQMDFLADAGYQVVDIARIVDMLAGDVPPNVLGLSFDDGYRDVAENALPMLEERGFCATVFVATAVIDGKAAMTWYRSQPPLLSWAEIGALERGGTLRFEAHTLTHPSLLAVDDEQAREEIADSKTVLETQLARPVSLFCYPAGLFGERERQLVKEAGYRAAVSCEPGTNDSRTDPFALRRLQIDARDGLLDFKAKVGGGHDTHLPLQGLYRSYRRRRYGAGRGRPRLLSSRR